MDNTTRIVMVLAALTAFSIGCSKADKPKPAPAEAAQAENWEPDSVALPEGHTADDGHDHSVHDHDGHDHSAHAKSGGDKDGQDHSGHDHDGHDH